MAGIFHDNDASGRNARRRFVKRGEHCFVQINIDVGNGDVRNVGGDFLFDDVVAAIPSVACDPDQTASALASAAS